MSVDTWVFTIYTVALILTVICGVISYYVDKMLKSKGAIGLVPKSWRRDLRYLILPIVECLIVAAMYLAGGELQEIVSESLFGLVLIMFDSFLIPMMYLENWKSLKNDDDSYNFISGWRRKQDEA